MKVKKLITSNKFRNNSFNNRSILIINSIKNRSIYLNKIIICFLKDIKILIINFISKKFFKVKNNQINLFNRNKNSNFIIRKMNKQKINNKERKIKIKKRNLWIKNFLKKFMMKKNILIENNNSNSKFKMTIRSFQTTTINNNLKILNS